MVQMDTLGKLQCFIVIPSKSSSGGFPEVVTLQNWNDVYRSECDSIKSSYLAKIEGDLKTEWVFIPNREWI